MALCLPRGVTARVRTTMVLPQMGRVNYTTQKRSGK